MENHGVRVAQYGFVKVLLWKYCTPKYEAQTLYLRRVSLPNGRCGS